MAGFLLRLPVAGPWPVSDERLSYGLPYPLNRIGHFCITLRRRNSRGQNLTAGSGSFLSRLLTDHRFAFHLQLIFVSM
jgi:hypothetical protein